ncbi:zeta toxin [Sphingobacteriaceae bacterium]|nr:zeta toxin [Sphingobacteriaceae bacterium]
MIAGCNGAGKTTASYAMLPEILNCKEFVNADEIAKGLSPFQPDKVAFESGRIMLHRIRELLANGNDFAFETTLSTRSYVSLIKEAKQLGYKVTLVFFWLDSFETAKERVKHRVLLGGHDIPEDIIERRYKRGIQNLTKLYISQVDYWMVFDNTKESRLVAEGTNSLGFNIINSDIWSRISNGQ